MTEGLRKQIERLVTRLFKQRDATLEARVTAIVEARLDEAMTELHTQLDLIDGGGA